MAKTLMTLRSQPMHVGVILMLALRNLRRQLRRSILTASAMVIGGWSADRPHAKKSAEVLAEGVDSAWCDGVSRCKPDRLEALASRVMAVQALKPDTAGTDSATIVSSLLQSLRESGSVVVQCESVLAVDAGSDESARLGALQCVRGLSFENSGVVSESEASLFGVLKDHLCGDTLSCEEQLSRLLSAFVLVDPKEGAEHAAAGAHRTLARSGRTPTCPGA